MSSRTDRYGLARLGSGDQLSENGYQFTDADRALTDRLLYLGAEGHHHSGAVAVIGTPAAPGLSTSATGGSVPASRRVYYKVTVVDVAGNESAPSTEAFVDTPAAVAAPAAPSFSVVSSGGTLLAGQYFYVLSAYTGTTSNETKAAAPIAVTVPIGTTTNRVLLVLPTLPSGATGFNVYRKKPGGSRLDFLASVVGAGPTFTDTGLTEDCNRTVPVLNTTNATNRVLVVFTGSLAAGETWRIYRSYVTGLYAGSLLHHVVEETSEGSGIIAVSYYDTGLSTMAGAPPATSQSVGSPAKVQLQDSAEVRGAAPQSRVSGFPYVARLWTPGAVSAGAQRSVWTCEFPRATLLGCRAVLGRGAAPMAQPVIVDVLVGSGATPTYSTVFTSTGDRPQVAVGAQVGTRVPPTERHELALGDAVGWTVAQAGGGATPTDFDLELFLYLMAHGYESALSHVPTFDKYAPAGLLAWYKADALGLTNGAAVATFTDSSGNSRHAAQATTASKPTFLTNALNGLPVVAFDGTDDFLQTASFSQSQPWTMFLVARTADTGSTTRAFVDTGISGSVNGGIGQLASSIYVSAGSGLAQIVAPRDNNYHVLTLVADGAASEARIGGGPDLLVPTLSTDAIAGLTLGARGSGAAAFHQGQIAELAVFAGAMGAYDANTVGRALAAKWALGWDEV